MQQDLDMKDTIRSQIKMDEPVIFVGGSRQIFGAPASPNIDISDAYSLPFFFGLGDHGAILSNLSQHLLIGGNINKILLPNI